MMLQRYGLGHSTSLYSTVVFDPIFTPLFTAVLGTGGITIGASTITYASIASAIATTALSIGIRMLMAPKPPKPEAAKVPLTQSIPYRIWAVGRTRMAGAYMLWESKGHRLFGIQAMAGHRIKSFNRYWLHDDEVSLDGSGWVISPGGGRYGNTSVQIQTRLGLPTETAYANAVADFSSEGLWTNDHRGDGQASLCMFAGATRMKDQQKRFPYGVPQVSVELDGALCWDFRDPAQNPADPSTWQWTRNSAIITAWHLCFNEFGFGLDYQKALLPVIDLWKEEADICDEAVTLAGGGTEKRYECNGFDTTENGPKAGLNAMLAACDGHLVARGDGARILTVGKFRESRCVTLSDRDIVGHNIQYDVLFEDECNRLIPKFTYPSTDYTTSDTDYFEDVEAQLESGRILAEEAEYQWVHQWRQARRLGKRDWLRLRQKVKGSIDVRLSGINAVYSRWVRLDTPLRLPRLNGKLIENRRSLLALTRGGFSMDIVQHPDNIDAWNPAVDEGVQPPVPNQPAVSGIVTPVINLVQSKANGGSVYIRVVVIDPGDASLTPIVRYRVADIGAGVPGAWVEQSFPDAQPSIGYINLNTNTVPVNQALEVQVAYTSPGGAYSAWSTTESVTSTADPTPPGAVTGVSVTPGSGTATFNWTAPNSANYAGAKIYWNTVNNFGTATYLSPPEYGAPSSTDSASRTISAGTRYAWIVSINSSGIEGTPVATGSFVVT
ncbi:hypothetical protein [Ensifer sp.]|jgi:hypothetical protein|uniref:hypothetical protein n=1 Tax=Ensifer sp. TaxID=1872086 RepID=UPI002E0D288B|nr:hypothetical protein [Ensifer sp.]